MPKTEPALSPQPMNADFLFERFQDLRVLVLGDVMLDRYYYGNVERISPEAPVPVFNYARSEDRLGGAANVAINLQSLGAQVLLLSVIGQDADGEAFSQCLEQRHISSDYLLPLAQRPTTCKTRFLAKNQQLLRMDKELTTLLASSEENTLLQRLEQIIEQQQPQLLILQDYNKGVLSPRLIAAALQLAERHGIPVAVDPKHDHFFSYQNATLFKPNLSEVNQALGLRVDAEDPAQLQAAAQTLQARLNCRYLLLTLGERGMYLAEEGKPPVHLPAHVRNIADVCGAGDTVISVAALSLAAGATPLQASQLANLAGGIVCEYVGIVPVPRGRLLVEAQQFSQA